MIKKLLLIILVFNLTSCAKELHSDKVFVDKLLDLVTKTSSQTYRGEEYVELKNLYDTLATSIPEDHEEYFILVDRLEKRGFKITNRGRGNFPPLGPRIIIVELKRKSCVCEVNKIYYSTVHPDTYQMAEGINCKRIKA